MKLGLAFTIRRIMEVPKSDHSGDDFYKLVEEQKKALENQGWIVEVLDDDDLDEDLDDEEVFDDEEDLDEDLDDEGDFDDEG